MNDKRPTEDELRQFASNYLDPVRLRARVNHMGLFLLSFELLRDLVLDKPVSFFSNDVKIVDGELKAERTPEYEKEVLSLAAGRFEASLRWLQMMNALLGDDVADIMKLLDYRNVIAHEPHRVLNDQDTRYQADAVNRVRAYHRRIGNFWGNIEVDWNPEINRDEVDRDGVTMLATLLLDHIAGVLGEEKMS